MLPKGWTLMPLGALLEAAPQNGYSPVCPGEPTGKWILGLGALGDDGIDLSQAKPAPIDDPVVDRFLLRPGDFLISRSNTLDRVGRIAVFRGDIDQCAYPDLMMRFRIDASHANPDYIEVYLRSERVSKYIQRHATGTSGSMKKINQGVVEGIPVVLPPLTLQREITELLSTWTIAIEKTEQLIAAKEQHYAHELSRFIGQEQHSQHHISEFAHEVSERNRDSACVRVLSVTNDRGFVLPEDQFERRVASEDLSNYKVVLKGQYAYNPSRINVGSIARLDDYDMGVLSPMYAVFAIDEAKVNSDFFKHWLDSHEARERIKRSAQGSVRETVSFSEFSHIRFPLPLLEQQQKIANYLNTLREEIALLAAYAGKLKEQKRGLMQKFLTGQWRVNAPKEVCA